MPSESTQSTKTAWRTKTNPGNEVGIAREPLGSREGGDELVRILTFRRRIQKDSVRIEEAAAILGYSVRTVYRKLERHLLEGSWRGRHCFISLRSLAQYIRQYLYRPTRSFNVQNLRHSNQEDLMDLSDSLSENLALARWEDDGGPPPPEPCDSPKSESPNADQNERETKAAQEPQRTAAILNRLPIPSKRRSGRQVHS
jgi:hypothetical protein